MNQLIDHLAQLDDCEPVAVETINGLAIFAANHGCATKPVPELIKYMRSYKPVRKALAVAIQALGRTAKKVSIDPYDAEEALAEIEALLKQEGK